VASDGKATRINRKATSIARKGVTPSIRSLLEILKTFFTKKKLIAMGGVINAISMFTSYNIANQSGLRPIDTTKGIKIGMVINIIVIPSIKHPRINKRT
jgi:N-acetylglucosamine kinase-like BadF-type ATPase